jgi:membrane associated rhomboid family serine protease
VIPVGDSPRTRGTAWVNLAIIAINILVFAYELSRGSDVDLFVDRWAVVPARILAGALVGGPAPVVTLVTATFLHAGWLHLGGNMLFLWVFGDNVEDRLGHGVYLLFYLVCGVAANLAQVVVDPASTIPALGASGAIAGVMGAYAITFPGARVSVLFPLLFFFWIVDVPALLLIGVWFVTQFFNGVATLAVTGIGGGGIAWWAHIGGFVVGLILMLILPKQLSRSRADGYLGSERRARDDTGFVGLAIGIVSLVSQLIQLAVGARIVVRFLGLAPIATEATLLGELIRLTNPLVLPFAIVIPAWRVGGHVVDLPAIVALVICYLIGMAIISAMGTTAVRSGTRYPQRSA